MAITNGYATLADIKDFVEVATADTAHDTDLERAVEAASRMIDQYVGRVFYDSGSATAKTFRTDDAYRLGVPDFHTTTGLVVETDTGNDGTYATTWASTDYQVEPTAPQDGWPWNRIVAIDGRTFPTSGRRPRVRVTARWGWAAVPTDVEQTCLIVAGELWRRKDAPFGVVGFGATGEAVRINSTERVMMSRLDSYSDRRFLVH